MPENTSSHRGIAPPPRKCARGATGKTIHGAAKGCAYTGRLANLMNMPLDVFFEISSHLHPLDLLHLARASKKLRSVTLSSKSRSVWISSLAGIEGLPPCPKDMSEPAYSALLFSRVCNLCSAARPCWVDYAIRIRLCKSCYKKNILTGQEILSDVEPSLQKLVMSMTPCEVGKDISIAVGLEQSSSHKPGNKYYAPQLKRTLTVALARRPQSDGEPAADYLRSLTSDSINFHKHATALLRWEDGVAWRKQKDEDALTASREASIIKKLQDLGYTEDDFPSADVTDWTKIVDQPKELTDRIWHNIKPKLEMLLRDERENRIREAYQLRVEDRLTQIDRLYEEFVDGLPEEDRALCPNLYNARRLPSIDALARENDGEGGVTSGEFLALASQILREIEVYKAGAKGVAIIAMAEYFSRKGDRARLEDIVHLGLNLNLDQALARHYALFECVRWRHPLGPEPHYLRFQDLHNHWRTQHPTLEWGFRDTVGPGSWGYIRVAGDFYYGGQDGNLVLDAAGLPHDTPMSVLTELVKSGRLYCSCGDPALPPPEQLDWPKFFAHIAEDLKRFRTREREGQPDSDKPKPVSKYVLHTHHPLSGPDTCIKLLPEGVDTALAHVRAFVIDAKTRKKVEERLAQRPGPSPAWTHICRVCKALTSRYHLRGRGHEALELPDTPEGIVHHLRGWHGKKFEKMDILFHSTPHRK